MNINSRLVRYVGHDMFFIPSINGICLLYAPTIRILLRVTPPYKIRQRVIVQTPHEKINFL